MRSGLGHNTRHRGRRAIDQPLLISLLLLIALALWHLGKSTLIKILLGELQAVEGLVWLNSNVRIAYFTQHHVDQLNLGLTAVQWLKELFPGTLDVECRRHLGKFGLIGDLTLMQIGNLSGGQKSRLAFAIITWKEPHSQSSGTIHPHTPCDARVLRVSGTDLTSRSCLCVDWRVNMHLVLIMDEPTNHLDMEVRLRIHAPTPAAM
jgi:hypothetical protein